MTVFDDFFANIINALNPSFSSFIKIIQDDMLNTASLLESESSYFQGLFNVFINVGILFAVMYFLLEISNTAMTTELTPEKIVKSFMKLMVAILIVKNGYQILTLIGNYGAKLAEAINVPIGSITTLTSAEISGGIWAFLIALACFLPGLFITVIVWVYSKIIMYSRMIEMGIQIALSPIALSDLVNGGTKSNAMNFLRKFLALAIQGFIIVIAIAVFTELSATMSISGGFMRLLEAVGIDSAIITGSMAGGMYAQMISVGIIGGNTAFLIGGALYCAVVYVTQALILISFMGKSKQIATDIVGLG